MFYTTELDAQFRFGDIVKGFTHATPNIVEPINSIHHNYKIEIATPKYSVILSPCCSIGNGTILIAPLSTIEKSWGQIEYIREDLLRINKLMKSMDAIHPRHWENFSEDKQAQIMNEPLTYNYLEYFVYASNDIFDSYAYDYKHNDTLTTNCYTIDFRNIYKINCKNIKSAVDAPLSAKVAQLTIEARADLRLKMKEYFGRIPQEDQI